MHGEDPCQQPSGKATKLGTRRLACRDGVSEVAPVYELEDHHGTSTAGHLDGPGVMQEDDVLAGDSSVAFNLPLEAIGAVPRAVNDLVSGRSTVESRSPCFAEAACSQVLDVGDPHGLANLILAELLV